MKGRPLRFRNLPGRKYISGVDTFIRHRLVSELARNFRPTSILDCGGKGLLSLFMREVRVTTANIKSADINYSGESLPVLDNSFDLVVSLDTLEHLPRARRMAFIRDVQRVAKKGLIICAPFGTAEHLAYEKQFLAAGIQSGESSFYLAEHVKYGLPIPAEVVDMANILDVRIYYQGNFREIVTVKNSNRAQAYIALLSQVLRNIITDIRWHKGHHLSDSFTPYTNRFFLIAEKCDNGR